MHLLTTTGTSFDDIVEPVDLGQTPGDVMVLSFADSDLAALAAAWAAERELLPSVRLAHLRDLRHPMSVDVWIERAGVHANDPRKLYLEALKRANGIVDVTPPTDHRSSNRRYPQHQS